MADKFQKQVNTLDSILTDGFVITPSDTTEFTQPTRVLYIGNTGDITVVMISGTTLSFTNVTSGQILPFRVSKVMATGTTATNIIGMF